MAKLVFGMNQSLDGYVDHVAFGPSPVLFRHFIAEAKTQVGSIYGRRSYEIMRYWDEDHPEWDSAEHDFAAAWRNQPKWVVSRSLNSVGPNAILVGEDLEASIRALEGRAPGRDRSGGSHPVVLGSGTPYFTRPPPPLRLVAHDQIDEAVIRLRYVPA